MIKKISKKTDKISLKWNERYIIEDSKKLKIPYYLLYFLIYIEDKRFYYHFGVDILAIFRAFIMNKKNKKLQGGSTLVQQLYDIKAEKKGNKRERTLKRKIRQAYFALIYTHKKTRRKIIIEYLENVYLGKSYYGINLASKYYFKKEISDLNKIECFILMERIATPNKINLKRTENILEREAIKSILTLSEINELRELYSRGEIYG